MIVNPLRLRWRRVVHQGQLLLRVLRLYMTYPFLRRGVHVTAQVALQRREVFAVVVHVVLKTASFRFKECLSYIVVARADKNMLSSAYLPSLSPILGHVSVREFYMPHPIRRPVERLTAHVAGQRCILFFLHVCVLIRTVYDFLHGRIEDSLSLA